MPDVQTAYVVVDRSRGQQLKDPAQLDAWFRDGSTDHIAKLCGWGGKGWDANTLLSQRDYVIQPRVG